MVEITYSVKFQSIFTYPIYYRRTAEIPYTQFRFLGGQFIDIDLRKWLLFDVYK